MSRVASRILDDVRGRMLEDIVLMETLRAFASGRQPRRAFKLMFPRGEYDLVIADPESRTCSIFEVKHSLARTKDQTRHLRDAEMLSATEAQFGRIAGRTVLYRGADASEPDGIAYRNVETYLASLGSVEMI